MADEIFYGPWRVEVVGGDAVRPQRFVIAGSDNADGAYPGALGTGVNVEGDHWTVTMEWQDHAVFRASEIARTATFDVQRGLLVTLGADDLSGGGDRDFNDLILLLSSNDPELNPNPPSGNPYDFSYPESFLEPGNGDGDHDQR